MNRKKLPRAIVPATNNAAALLAANTAEAAPDSSRLRDSTSRRVGEGNVIEIVPHSQATAGGVRDGQARPQPSTRDPKRRSRALAIVSRFAAGSAVGGMLPLPLVSFAGVTAVIVRMVKSLSDHYGVPFEQDRARAIVVGLVGGAMPAGVATVTASTLALVLPPAAALGVAASAISAAAFTQSVGRIFIEHFESGATWDDFSRGSSHN